ncbi:MAG: hypothetical protein AAB370_10360 [Verrucomicrobiota bacterium]
MTKAIWVLIILAVGYIGYLLYQQWDKARLEHETRKKEEATVIVGDNLPGMPYQLDQSLRTAKTSGPVAFQSWFKANESQLADPRKAWIELELCVAMSRQSPAEAKRIFAKVKGRVPPSSPVWSKVKELEKTFD